MATTTLWHNARLATLADDSDWGLIAHGALLVQGDRLAWVGALRDLPAAERARVDAEHDLGGALTVEQVGEQRENDQKGEDGRARDE